LSAFGLAVTYLTLCAWEFSFGKINHGWLIIASTLMLSVAHSDADVRRRRYFTNSPVLFILALSIVAGMMSAALPKITTGWLSMGTQSAFGHFVANYVQADRTNALADIAMQRPMPVLWEIADGITVLIEAGFIIAFLKRSWFRCLAAMACAMHAGIALCMEITFWPNLVAYAAFYDWDAVVRTRTGKGCISLVRNASRADVVFAIGLAHSATVFCLGYPLSGMSLEANVSTIILLVAALVGWTMQLLTARTSHRDVAENTRKVARVAEGKLSSSFPSPNL
jgi:hypothetical protein